MKSLACIAVLAAAVPLYTAAAPSPQAAVLSAEARWMQATQERNADSLAAILAPDFVHVNYRGRVTNRPEELLRAKLPKPYEQHTTDHVVQILGSTAIVHGLNAITEGGRVVLRLRYTDVYQLVNGAWKAVSAQETAVR